MSKDGLKPIQTYVLVVEEEMEQNSDLQTSWAEANALEDDVEDDVEDDAEVEPNQFDLGSTSTSSFTSRPKRERQV